MKKLEQFKGKLIYLAAPYSHESEHVVELRMATVNKKFAYLISQGLMVLSPLTQGHVAHELCKCPSEWEFWRALSVRLLRCCDVMFVYTLDGYLRSNGVQEEIRIATELDMPIYYI